jgi:DNA invertase Pin-like site-specific DNA recombinase
MRLVGYTRVSTDRQAKEGHSLAGQEATLRDWAERNGHDLPHIIPDVMSGMKTAKLYGREAAVRLIESGLADGLLVLRYDRVTRSMLDAQELLSRSRAKGWAILTTDGGDSSDSGQMLMTDVEMSFAAAERRRISERTKEGLSAAVEAGKVLGCPPQVSEDAEQLILDNADTLSARAIAVLLAERGILTPTGKTDWTHAAVLRVIRRHARQEAA